MAAPGSSPFHHIPSSPHSDSGASLDRILGVDTDCRDDDSTQLSDSIDTLLDTSEIEVEFALSEHVPGTSSPIHSSNKDHSFEDSQVEVELALTDHVPGTSSPVHSSEASWPDILDELKVQTVHFQTHFPPMVCPWTFMSHEERYQRVVGQIERLLLSQIQNGMVQGDAPLGFTYPDYSDWSQVQYHPGYGLRPNLSASRMITTRLENRGSATKYSLIVLTLWSILELFDQNSFVTKRELYYQHINHYRSQVAVDECVKVIACMLRIPRLHLRILSTSKGLFMGNIVFHNAQGIQVIGSHATPIPQDITGISQLASDAKFILVVEKDAVFQRLADDNFAVIYQPCLVITGKGVPDLNTRQFLYHLWTHLKIPVLALMDGDPFGLEILCTYRFGSLPMTWSQELLPVPIMKWIGIFPSDIHQFSREHLKPLSKVDCAKIKSLLQRPYVEAHPELKQEILIMKEHGWKAEIEAVDSVGDFVIRQILSQHWC